MNKNLYRIIFSKARNMFIAVAENSKSQTKAAGESACKGAEEIEAQDGTALHQHWVVKSLVASISLWMPLAPVYAQIQADAGANPANRPVIGVGQNAQGQNVPVVNIQTPVNGVSHNIYKQMDVLSNGAVLNNSRTGAASAIAGSVGANPFLAKGEARLILNEINSTAATRFEGNMEVAGQRADVIIANPAGINIKGGGFINANKAIFTTGKPQLNADGSLKQFAVDQGKVTVSANAGSSLGLGGNSNNADYVDIYARALELNAQLHANQAVNVITGANTVSENLESIESKASASAAPALSVDIKSLGGMYANNIYLMGNEKGLGVSNAGTLQAVNNLVVTSAGKIVHSGTAAASDKKGGLVSIATTGTGADADIAVSGSINSYGLMNVDSGNDLNLNAKEIAVNYDAETKNSAALIVNAKGNVSLAAGTRINNLSTAGDLYLDAKNITLAENSEIRSNRGAAFIHADESLAAAKGVRLVALNDLKISADTDIRLLENTLHSTSGSINIQSAADTANLLQVDGGTVYAGQDLNVYGAGDVSLKNLSFNLVNDMVSLKNLNAYSGQNLKWDNSGTALPQIAGKMQLSAVNQLDLIKVSISSKDDINLQAGKVNLDATLDSQKNINISSNASDLTLSNVLTAQNDINVTALQGSVDVNSLKATSKTGEISIYANKNLNLNFNNIYFKESREEGVITDQVNLSGYKGVNLASVGDGVVNIKAANITSEQGDIRVNSNNGIIIKDESYYNVKKVRGRLGLGTRSVFIPKNYRTQLAAQSIYINNKNFNVDINGLTAKAMLGGIAIANQKEELKISNTSLESKSNTELYAKDLLTLKNVTATSDQHLALSSGGEIYINSEYSPSTVWIPGIATNLTAQGVVSLTAVGNQVMQNASLTGGAVLLEAKNLDVKPDIVFNAIGSDLLKNDAKLNSLNGDLSIQTSGEKGLTIDPKIMSLSAVGDIELIAKNGALQLAGYSGENGNGSEQIVKLNTVGGGISLEGTKIDIQGAQLTAQKDIEIVSSKDDVLIDGIKNDFNNKIAKAKFEKLIIEKKNATEELKLLDNAYYMEYSSLINNLQNYINEQFLKEPPITNLENYIEEFGARLNKHDVYVKNELLKFTKKYPVKIVSPDLGLAGKVAFAWLGIHLTGKELLAPKYDLAFIDNEIAFYSNYLNGYEHNSTSIEGSSGGINILSAKGLSISGAELTAKAGQVNLESRGVLTDQYTLTANPGTAAQAKKISASMIIDGHTNFYDKGNENDANYSMRTLVNPTVINGAKGVSIRTVGTTSDDNLIMQATGILSQGDVKIESNKNILFDSAIEQSYDRSTTTEKKKSWGGLKKKYITTVSENNAADAASVDIYGKNISIESKDQNKNVSIDIYSGKFTADGGKLSIRAGGNLNFYTVEESSSSNVDITKKSSFAGIKYNRSSTNATRTQATELPATLKADYIGTKSGFDTRLEGTEFEYLKDATVEAGGKLELIAAKTSITELLKKEKNSVVWQSMQDKGSITETAELPQFNGPVLPTFKAAGGLSVQIPISEKDQNKAVIRDEILKLANQPGNAYLKELVNRKDVDWNTVILAQKDWDYKSQGLTGAGAAIIVIIVTIVTMGAGTAVAAGAAGAGGAAAGGATVGMGASMLGAAGVTTATVGGVTTITGVSALGAMANAAVTSLATQASIGLINNGGDIGKTLKDLGSKDSVKNLAASVVTAGLLNQVGTALSLKPDSTLLPDRLINNFTTSVGSTLVQTAIKGGDLEDNLKVALLAGLAGAIQGELASQIGEHLDKVDPSVFEYTIHKIAHAAAGCAVAAATKASCEAGAIGAGVGEIVAELMIPEGKTALDLTDDERTRIKDTSKLIAGTTAAFAGYDVNTAANSANIAVENNSLGKLATTSGKVAYKVAKRIMEDQAKGKKINSADVVEMFKKEGIQGIVDIGDNITTLINPYSSLGDKAFAAVDLLIGIDLKAGKNIDALKADQKVIKKNFNQAPKFQGASSTTLTRLDSILSTSTNTTSGKGVLNYTQDAKISRLSDYKLLTVGGQTVKDTETFKMTVLQDGTKVIFRPSTTGPKTIEVQKANGQKVMEIRYEK